MRNGKPKNAVRQLATHATWRERATTKHIWSLALRRADPAWEDSIAPAPLHLSFDFYSMRFTSSSRAECGAPLQSLKTTSARLTGRSGTVDYGLQAETILTCGLPNQPSQSPSRIHAKW